jgi:hypothetical protein
MQQKEKTLDGSTEVGKSGLQVTNNPLSLSQSAGFPAGAGNLFSCSTIKQNQVFLLIYFSP